MRALLIEMYGSRLTAFRCYTNPVLSWQKGTSDIHQRIYSAIRKAIYETAEVSSLGHETAAAPDFLLNQTVFANFISLRRLSFLRYAYLTTPSGTQILHAELFMDNDLDKMWKEVYVIQSQSNATIYFEGLRKTMK
jgi:hypothetical protein